MTQDLQRLIAALREELKHYGEMLALLEQQQEGAQNRTADHAFTTTGAIHRQAEAILAARRNSDVRRRALARELRQDETSTVPQLMPLIPPQYRPLLRSLAEENTALFQSVRRAARQNHQTLTRSVESMQRFLALLFPEGQSVAA